MKKRDYAEITDARKSICPKCEKANSGRTVRTSGFPPKHHVECWNCGATTHKCLTEAEAEARWYYGWLKEWWEH